jgi:hypothetical protein
MSSPLKPEHAEIASRSFAEWAQREGILAGITLEKCTELARVFVSGFACGVGVAAADAMMADFAENFATLTAQSNPGGADCPVPADQPDHL